MDQDIAPALPFATNAQLVQELINRQTFRGAIIWQPAFAGDFTIKDDWEWRGKNCDAGSVFRQIGAALQPTAPPAEGIVLPPTV